MMTSDKSLFDTLQDEFCPILDSSLIAAFLADINYDINGKEVPPTRKQIAELRTTLKDLALHAEVHSDTSDLSDPIFSSCRRDETTSSWTSPLSIDEDSHFQANVPASSALKFLEKALPDVPTSKLKTALDDRDGDDLDMWDVIETILSQESIHEMEERGFDNFEESQAEWGTPPFSFDSGWESVKQKRPPPGPLKRQATARNKASSSKSKFKKMILSDVRQQHHAQYKQRQNSAGRNRSSPSILHTDPWTQLSFLTNQLSRLLPPNPASYFLSYFHSPAHATSYEAAQAALMSLLCRSDISGKENGNATVALINILDIILPEDGDLDLDERTRIVSDVELAINVTEGRTNDALELTYLLRDLDAHGIGVNHRPLSSLPSSPVSPHGTMGPVQASQTGKGKSRFLMQAHYKGGDEHDHLKYGTDYFRHRMRQAMARRDEALMNAAIMYRKGNRKNRGGEVAMYYAEKAREEQKLIRQESLNAARAMVLERRTADGCNHDVVDVHWTTVAEATLIVKEILDEEGHTPTQSKPLRIITGKGKHSTGGIGVLKPALRDALIKGGWVVSSFEAGLLVKGRRA